MIVIPLYPLVADVEGQRCRADAPAVPAGFSRSGVTFAPLALAV